MTRSNSPRLLLLAVACLIGCRVGSSQAQVPQGADLWSVKVSAGRMTYMASEYSSSGQRLNQEEGHLVNAAWTVTGPFGPGIGRLQLEQARNDATYDGQTQSGAKLYTQTRIHIQSLDATWLFPLTTTGQHHWFLLGGAGWLEVLRDIRAAPPNPPMLPAGSQPLSETLLAGTAHFGVAHRYELAQGSPWTIQSEFQLRTQVKSRLKVNSYGVFDSVTVSPGRGNGWRLETMATYRLNPKWNIGLRLRREALRPASSPSVTAFKNGIPAAVVQYPGSRQYMTITAFETTWRF